MIYAIAVFIALQIVDVWLTLEVIKRGGRELNPVVAWIMSKTGNEAGLIVTKLVYVGVVFLVVPWLTVGVLWAICAAYAGLAVWNALQLRK